jgi:DNA-binding CsgD family transcriptional regulator/tetratricopeptide (TPR) repeat protein
MLAVHRAVTLMRLDRPEAAGSVLRIAREDWLGLDVDTRTQLVLTEARLYRSLGESAKAHECWMMAKSIAEEASDASLLARAHVGLARSYADVGATDETLHEAFAAVRTADREHHGPALIEAYTTIYIAYHTLRRYSDAVEYARRAYDVAHEKGTSLERLNTSCNLALAVADVGDVRQGFEILRMGRPLLAQIGRDVSKAHHLHTLGQLHLTAMQYRSAINVMSQSVALYAGLQHTSELHSAQFILAQAFRGLGRIDEAMALADGIIAYYAGSEEHYDPLLASVLEFASTIEYERGAYQRACDHLRELMRVRARTHKENARRLASVLDIRYRVDKLQRDAKRIEAENNDMRAQLAGAAIRLVQQATAQKRAPSVVEAEWRLFKLQFDRVHTGVMRRIAGEYPDLTGAELRVCAMLIASFATKDIAAVLSCSIRTVEWHRANIRRKLNIRSGANLGAHLARYAAR